MPLHAEGKVKVLGVTSPERLAIAGNVPTLAEQGVPIVDAGWWGMCAASGVPAPVLATLNQHVRAAVAAGDYRATMERSGVLAVSSTLAEAAELMAQTSRDAAVKIRELGIEQLE
jgi:tripartite-type tricarboxylate transporter receptor subunit TctC